MSLEGSEGMTVMAAECERKMTGDLQADGASTASPAEERLTEDGRQSPAAAAICRGARRLLAGHALATLTEVGLPNGRRADILALSAKGEITIVEVKSSVTDFRTDLKWPDYRDFCDRLLFAVAPDFPAELIPVDVGLIVADRFGGEIVRDAPVTPLSGSRRRSLLLRIARLGAGRLHSREDPEFRVDWDVVA